MYFKYNIGEIVVLKGAQDPTPFTIVNRVENSRGKYYLLTNNTGLKRPSGEDSIVLWDTHKKYGRDILVAG